MGSGGLAGAGMMGGSFGMPFAAGMPLGAAGGGINLGLGGGLQMGLGGNALAAALGLAGPAGLSAAGTSGLELQLLRALLGRPAGNGNGADAGTAAPPAAGEAEAQMRRLNTSITDITTRINTELAGVQQMRGEMNQQHLAIETLANRLQAFEKRLDALDKKKPGTE
jgi:hypothetical protein